MMIYVEDYDLYVPLTAAEMDEVKKNYTHYYGLYTEKCSQLTPKQESIVKEVIVEELDKGTGSMKIALLIKEMHNKFWKANASRYDKEFNMEGYGFDGNFKKFLMDNYRCEQIPKYQIHEKTVI